jgi:intracellular sulfur oxidation DsrE/DsrF family protein
MKLYRNTTFAAIATSIALLTLTPSAIAAEPDKAVYHIDNAAVQATKALRNIRNHLDTVPSTRVVVVTHAEGVDFLFEGAKDSKNPNVDYPSLVSALKARGVRFEVCEITLKNRNLKREQFSLDAEFTPSGVARVTQLQTREGFAYLKP